jgi:molecular chaperone GrpE
MGESQHFPDPEQDEDQESAATPETEQHDLNLDDAESNDTATSDEELGRLRDALLRTRAEMENLRKRSEREIEKSRKFAVEALLRDLAPVIDSLDQGLEQSDSADAQGLSLTRKLLIDTLSRYGLKVLDPIGERFDPSWHEAMSMQPSEEHEPDTVMIVLQRGYGLHDRVIRPARVIVAREP